MSMFVVSRAHGAPPTTVPPDEVGVHVFTQLWKTRQQPYDSLADGDTLYWADQKTRELRWELRVRNVRKVRCSGMNEYAGYLRNWFGVLEPETDYGAGRSDRWLLAWENELVRPLGIPLPADFKLGRNGFKLISPEEHELLGLPHPGDPAVLPVSSVDGPAPVFGPGARRSIPAHVREAVFARDGRQCQNRSCSTTEGPFHLDHRFPFSKGGPSTVDNLQVLCASCNLSKGARTDEPIAELLLPDSALPRLLVTTGRTRPDTVGAAAEALTEALTQGAVTVEEAALAVLATLGDVNWYDEYCAELAAAFGEVGSPDADAWFLLIDHLAVTYDNMTLLNARWDEFEALLAEPGLVGATAAAVVAPSRVLAHLYVIENQDDSAPEIVNLISRSPQAIDLIAQGKSCPEPATARRVLPLEFLDLAERVGGRTARVEDINSLFGHLAAVGSPVDGLAYHIAMLVLTVWHDQTGDGKFLDAAIECAVAATSSLHSPSAANSCRWVADLADRRGEIGDLELAEFYVRVADSIEQAELLDQNEGDSQR